MEKGLHVAHSRDPSERTDSHIHQAAAAPHSGRSASSSPHPVTPANPQAGHPHPCTCLRMHCFFFTTMQSLAFSLLSRKNNNNNSSPRAGTPECGDMTAGLSVAREHAPKDKSSTDVSTCKQHSGHGDSAKDHGTHRAARNARAGRSLLPSDRQKGLPQSTTFVRPESRWKCRI